MKSCFKFIAKPGKMTLDRDDFMMGVPTLYSVNFCPPARATMTRPKRQPEATRKSSTSSETGSIAASASAVQPGQKTKVVIDGTTQQEIVIAVDAASVLENAYSNMSDQDLRGAHIANIDGAQ